MQQWLTPNVASHMAIQDGDQTCEKKDDGPDQEHPEEEKAILGSE